MKCKYCKTKISFYHWMLYFGKCFHCDLKIDQDSVERQTWESEHERQRKSSKEYWEDKKQEDKDAE